MNIDLLHDFLRQHEAHRVGRLIKSTNELISWFRKAELPIIWVRQEFAPDLSDAFLEMRERGIHIAIAGTEGAQIDRRLDWNATDITIIKKRYSAFFGTALDDVLDRLGATDVVLAGVNTHACVRTAAIDAYQRDLKVILAADCMSSYDQEHAAITLRYIDGKIGKVMDNGEIREHIRNL
jgi:nicotinamidase-related amidase